MSTLLSSDVRLLESINSSVLQGGGKMVRPMLALLSAGAAVRMNRRQEGIQPENRIEVFLDTHFDDDTMKKIYTNSKSVD